MNRTGLITLYSLAMHTTGQFIEAAFLRMGSGGLDLTVRESPVVTPPKKNKKPSPRLNNHDWKTSTFLLGRLVFFLGELLNFWIKKNLL